MSNSDGSKRIYVSIRGLSQTDLQRTLAFLAPDESRRTMYLVGGEDGNTYEFTGDENETEETLRQRIEDCLTRFSGVSYAFIEHLVQKSVF